MALTILCCLAKLQINMISQEFHLPHLEDSLAEFLASIQALPRSRVVSVCSDLAVWHVPRLKDSTPLRAQSSLSATTTLEATVEQCTLSLLEGAVLGAQKGQSVVCIYAKDGGLGTPDEWLKALCNHCERYERLPPIPHQPPQYVESPLERDNSPLSLVVQATAQMGPGAYSEALSEVGTCVSVHASAKCAATTLWASARGICADVIASFVIPAAFPSVERGVCMVQSLVSFRLHDLLDSFSVQDCTNRRAHAVLKRMAPDLSAAILRLSANYDGACLLCPRFAPAQVCYCPQLQLDESGQEWEVNGAAANDWDNPRLPCLSGSAYIMPDENSVVVPFTSDAALALLHSAFLLSNCTQIDSVDQRDPQLGQALFDGLANCPELLGSVARADSQALRNLLPCLPHDVRDVLAPRLDDLPESAADKIQHIVTAFSSSKARDGPTAQPTELEACVAKARVERMRKLR